MLKGGYQIIDLGDKEHTSGVGMTHDGIYDKIEGTRKAILLSGIVIDDVEYHDTFINPVVNGTKYVAVVNVNPSKNEEYVINIQDNDVVTFTKTTSPD